MVIYFTGTGNSQYVAEAIGDKLGTKVVSSNQYIKEERKGTFKSKKPFVFVFPIYLSTIAETFADFIRRCEFQGSKDAYFVATCAGVMGAAPNTCADFCKEKGLNYMGTELIVMPQNYIALFKMTEEEECERRLDAALETVEEICQKIKANEILDGKMVSRLEYQGTKAVEKIYNGFFTQTKKYYVTDACIGCGLCEKVCPLNNIVMWDGKPEWIGKCVHCMACINRCPKEAIEYGKNTIGKTRYVCKKYVPQKENTEEIRMENENV